MELSWYNRVEGFFSRKPDEGKVFVPLSAEEYNFCHDSINSHPSVTIRPPPPSDLSILTSLAPPLTSPECMEAENFYSRFSDCAINSCSQLLAEIMEQQLHAPLLIPIWRAGLAFMFGCTSDSAVANVAAHRDANSGSVSVYYSDPCLKASLCSHESVVLLDPYVGTASTIIAVLDEISSLLGRELKGEEIHVGSLFLAPEGAMRLLCRYPGISLTASYIDCYLDDRGWFASANEGMYFSDFGDYFSVSGLSDGRLSQLYATGVLSQESLSVLRSMRPAMHRHH